MNLQPRSDCLVLVSLRAYGQTDRNTQTCYRPQGKVMFSQVSVCPQSASWTLAHCSALLRCGRYASYWNAFLYMYLNIDFFRHYSFMCEFPFTLVSTGFAFLISPYVDASFNWNSTIFKLRWVETRQFWIFIWGGGVPT